MPRALVLSLILAIALSGCFSKGPSEAEMEKQAAQAIDAFSRDVGPEGRLAGIEVTGWIRVAMPPVTVTLNPEVGIDFGPDGAVLIDGTLADMRFTGYCDPERTIAITQNTNKYGMQDASIESRNLVGHCTGEGSEALLTPFLQFELVDPALLTGALSASDLEAKSFAKQGKSIEAEYVASGPSGTTDLFFEIRGDKVLQIIAENRDSKIVMDMEYGEREALLVPEAAQRMPSPVSGTARVDEDGWHWTGHTREGGPVAEYRLEVYSRSAQVSCTSADSDPLVAFDLADGPDQRRDGWHLFVLDDGDGTLGKGDEIHLRHPSSAVQEFDFQVRFVDEWTGTTAGPSCAIPAAPIGALVLGIAALSWVRRRV